MTTALRDAPMRVLRALACALGLGGMALACPPAPAPFVPFDGEPFRFRADLVDAAACSVAWFTLDESGIRSLDIDSSLDEWLMLDHPTSFPLFLEPDQVAGPTVFDEVAANRVTLDDRSFVVAFGIRFDRVYNEAIFMRLVFELPVRPSAVVPAAPAAPPEPTLVEVQRERWGAFEVVREAYASAPQWTQVRVLDQDGFVHWETETTVSWVSWDVAVQEYFGDGTLVLSVMGYSPGGTCCDWEYHLIQQEGGLVLIAGGRDSFFGDDDGDGVPERISFESFSLQPSQGTFSLPVVQMWDPVRRAFGPLLARERSRTLEEWLATSRRGLSFAVANGRDTVAPALRVYARAYYRDPSAASAEREHLRGLLPATATEQVEALYPAVEATIDAFVAEAATWQPENLRGD